MSLAGDLLLACNEQNRAAVSRIFLIEACKIDSFTASSTNHSFTAVTTDATSDVWYEYQGEFETKGFNMEGSNENGTATFTNTLEAKVQGIDKTKLKRLQDMINARKVVAVFESTNKVSSNKRAFVIGWDDILGVDAAGMPNVNGVIEAALDGDNSLTFTLTAKHAELIREYVGTIAANSGTITFGN
jgi:hypothetical protein